MIKIHKNILNRKVNFRYQIEKKITSGIQLLGWEVKSIRTGRVSISEGYISIKNNEAYLLGTHFQPLATTFQNKLCDSKRIRKLLLKKKEIHFLFNFYLKKKYTIVPMKLFWKKSWCKLILGIAYSKNTKDKRLDEKNRLWKIEKERILKKSRF